MGMLSRQNVTVSPKEGLYTGEAHSHIKYTKGSQSLHNTAESKVVQTICYLSTANIGPKSPLCPRPMIMVTKDGGIKMVCHH